MTSRTALTIALLVQQVLADPEWAQQLTDADLRGLTPFWSNINPYGTCHLDMADTLDLGIPVREESAAVSV